MNCSFSEEQLALYSGGDLSAEESTVVSEHLDKCANCRAALAELSASLLFFADTCPAPGSEDLRAVRNGVMQWLSGKRKMGRFPQIAAAAASIALITAPFLLHRNEHPVSQSPEVADLRPLPLPPITELDFSDVSTARLVQRGHRAHKIAPGLRDVALLTRPDGTAELRAATADPNVVILLQMNGNSNEN